MTARKRALRRSVSDPALRSFITQTVFPSLRAAHVKVIFSYRLPEAPAPVAVAPTTDTDTIFDQSVQLSQSEASQPEASQPGPANAPLLSVGTNLLFDAMAVPNLNLELWLKQGWTLRLDGMYAWWSQPDRGHYWRLQGGNLTVRKYFSTAAFRGHHVGVLGGALRYDFCLGQKGVLSGGSDVPFRVRPSWTAGLEYGYSFAPLPRLRVDLSVAAGYVGGIYMRYRNDNGHSIWLSTHRRHWFGPIRAEVSLAWIIGKGGGI